MCNELKEKVKAEYMTYCTKYDYCDECVYKGSADCQVDFILDNYELTKKLDSELDRVNLALNTYDEEFKAYCRDHKCKKCNLYKNNNSCIRQFILAKERGIL